MNSALFLLQLIALCMAASTNSAELELLEKHERFHRSILSNQMNPWSSPIPSSNRLLGDPLIPPPPPPNCLLDTLELNREDILQTATDTLMPAIIGAAMDFASSCIVGYEMVTCYFDPSTIIESIAPICEDLGGTMEIISIEQTCSNNDLGREPLSKTVLGFPGCLASSCESLEEFLDELITPELLFFDPEADMSGSCTRSASAWEETEESRYCTEKQYAKFYSGMKKGKHVTKTCSWLSKQSIDEKRVICMNTSPFPDMKSARDACPKSCCSCMGNDEDEFFRKAKMVEGEKSVVTKPCVFLDTLDTEQRQKLCKKKRGFKKTRPARAECPQLCGTCPVVPSIPTVL